MLYKHWNKIKIISTILTAIIAFSIYLYINITFTPTIQNDEIVTLPTSGIEVTYGVITTLGYILIPGFCTLIMFAILDKIEEKCIY